MSSNLFHFLFYLNSQPHSRVKGLPMAQGIPPLPQQEELLGGLNHLCEDVIIESYTMNQHTYCLITSSVVVELSLAQFDYIHCAESDLASQSGFELRPQDVNLACTSALSTQPNWTFNINTNNSSRSFIC